MFKLIHGELIYLIQISGNEGNGVTGCCYFDETAEDGVSHWSVLIHAVEQIAQAEKLKYNRIIMNYYFFKLHLCFY